MICSLCLRIRKGSLPILFVISALCICSVVVVIDKNMTIMIPRDILPKPYGKYRVDLSNWTLSKSVTKKSVTDTSMAVLKMTSTLPNNPSKYFTYQTSRSGQGVTGEVNSTAEQGDHGVNLETSSTSDRTLLMNKRSSSPPPDTHSLTTLETKRFRSTENLETKAMITNNTNTIIKLPLTTRPSQQSIGSTILKILGSTRDSLQLNSGRPKYKCSKEFKSTHLMTSALEGRSGNELFQLAALLVAANESCYTACLPSKINLDSIFDIRNLERRDINTSHFGKLSEKGWGFYDGPISNKVQPNQNWTVTGFRQSFKYFHHKQQLVRSSLIFKDKIKEDVDSFFSTNALHNKTKIGIHVRRGDFLKKKNIDYGYFPSSLQYILKAMNYFNQTLNDTDLAFIFVSDTIQWCKDNINLANSYFSPMEDVGRDLFILTQCDHNIVTTGTFGWMGAWLNETGIVVYDKLYPTEKSQLWHGHKKKHYYPDWWLGL